MTSHTFPAGQIVRKDNEFRKILGEAGEVRFVSYGWEKKEANNKGSGGLKLSEGHSYAQTIHELNALGYVPVSPEEAGLVEEWEPKEGDRLWFVDESPSDCSYYKNNSWLRTLLKHGLLKPTREAAEAAYKRMGE